MPSDGSQAADRLGHEPDRIDDDQQGKVWYRTGTVRVARKTIARATTIPGRAYPANVRGLDEPWPSREG